MCIHPLFRGEYQEVSLLDALKQPLFMAYREGQPFNDNLLRPCPMLENPELLQEMVARTGAKSTDLQCPESADHLCGKCEAYTAEWAPIADELWEQEMEKKRKKKEMVH